MEQESISRLEILENIMDFYKVQPGMNKDEKLEKVEAYLVLMHALYNEYSNELVEIDICDVDYIENIFDCFNGYLNAVGEEVDKIFDENIMDLSLIPIFGFSIVLPIHGIEMIKTWNKFEQDCWQISEELSKLEELVESDLFFEKFVDLIGELMLRINSKLVVSVENLI